MTTPTSSRCLKLGALAKRLQSRLVYSTSASESRSLVSVDYRLLHSPFFAVSLRQLCQESDSRLYQVTPRASLILPLCRGVVSKVLPRSLEPSVTRTARILMLKAESLSSSWAASGGWQLVVQFGRERATGFVSCPVDGQADFFDAYVSAWECPDRTIQGAV